MLARHVPAGMRTARRSGLEGGLSEASPRMGQAQSASHWPCADAGGAVARAPWVVPGRCAGSEEPHELDPDGEVLGPARFHADLHASPVLGRHAVQGDDRGSHDGLVGDGTELRDAGEHHGVGSAEARQLHLPFEDTVAPEAEGLGGHLRIELCRARPSLRCRSPCSRSRVHEDCCGSCPFPSVRRGSRHGTDASVSAGHACTGISGRPGRCTGGSMKEVRFGPAVRTDRGCSGLPSQGGPDPCRCVPLKSGMYEPRINGSARR